MMGAFIWRVVWKATTTAALWFTGIYLLMLLCERLQR